MKFEGLEAWEYQNGVQLDVLNSLVYSKVEQVIKTQQWNSNQKVVKTESQNKA